MRRQNNKKTQKTQNQKNKEKESNNQRKLRESVVLICPLRPLR
jgi:hypothetical protein